MMRGILVTELGVKRKTISIDHCPTDDMNGDFVSNLLQGAKFCKFRNELVMEKC